MYKVLLLLAFSLTLTSGTPVNSNGRTKRGFEIESGDGEYHGMSSDHHALEGLEYSGGGQGEHSFPDFQFHSYQQEPEVHQVTKLIPVHKTLKVPHPHPVHHPIKVPYPVRVLEPYHIQIPVPQIVEKIVKVPVEKVVEYPVEKLVPYKVVKKVHVPVHKPYPVPVPVYKTKYVYHTKKYYHH